VIFQRQNLDKPGGGQIPGFLLAKESPRGGALLLHPYGASKEHMLGLAAALAEADWATLAIDLCGHGANSAEIGRGMLDEAECALQYLRRFGTTAAAGLSLGGRLALMSSADLAVAISPAVVTEISPQGKWMFENFPSLSVREPYPGYVVQLLKDLGPVRSHPRPCLILYAERDIPAILGGAGELKALLPNAEVRYIREEIRPDVQHENGFIRYLPRWFNHLDLKFNPEVMRTAAHWLAQAPVAQASGA
jgi:pimeloyl-ACP methyl ester carboxylesterase